MALLLNWLYYESIPKSHAWVITEPVEEESEYFDVELLEPDEEEEMRYVEVNPENPENEPDETPNISSQDQQAAQEDVQGPQNSTVPFIKGDDEESPKIVEGQMPVQEQQGGEPVERVDGRESNNQSDSQAQESTTPSENQPEQEYPEQGQGDRYQPAQSPAPGQAESPLSLQLPSILTEEIPNVAPPPPTPDFIDEVESDDEEGVDIKIIEEQEEVTEDDPTIQINVPPSVASALAKARKEQKALKEQFPSAQRNQQQQSVQNQRPQPQPRPRLSPKVLPGPLLNSQTYTARMGPIGFDAKFSQFGYYLQRMFDSIQLQWYSLLADVTISQENRPAYVVIEYILDKEGSVVEAEVIETNAGSLGTILCKDSIESRAPFGVWTRQMVDQLGDQTTITLKFIYL